MVSILLLQNGNFVGYYCFFSMLKSMQLEVFHPSRKNAFTNAKELSNFSMARLLLYAPVVGAVVTAATAELNITTEGKGWKYRKDGLLSVSLKQRAPEPVNGRYCSEVHKDDFVVCERTSVVATTKKKQTSRKSAQSPDKGNNLFQNTRLEGTCEEKYVQQRVYASDGIKKTVAFFAALLLTMLASPTMKIATALEGCIRNTAKEDTRRLSSGKDRLRHAKGMRCCGARHANIHKSPGTVSPN